MKILVYLIVACSFLSFAKTDAERSENEYVDVTITLKPNEIKSGGNAQLIVTFKPQKGIYINLDPPIEIRLEKDYATIGKIEIPKTKDGDYLNTQKPVKQNFKLKKNLQTGTYILKGQLVYFYCSDAEGWCSRFKQPIQLNISIIK